MDFAAAMEQNSDIGLSVSYLVSGGHGVEPVGQEAHHHTGHDQKAAHHDPEYQECRAVGDQAGRVLRHPQCQPVLTNQRRVLRVLTNQRRVLRVLTNQRKSEKSIDCIDQSDQRIDNVDQ